MLGRRSESTGLHMGRQAQMRPTFSSMIVQREEAISYVGSGEVEERLRVCMRKMEVRVPLEVYQYHMIHAYSS